MNSPFFIFGFMEKNWTLTPNYTKDQEITLFKELIPFVKNPTEETNAAYRIFSKLLLQRKITSVADAIQFNNLGFDDLHDPFLMLNMEKAVNRIIHAINEGQTIMVYGDYDVDGTTSVALMVNFLNHLEARLTYYIPDRYTEGYGISIKGIDTAHEQNVRLIIALDCGIKAVDKIDYANSKNVDFIICDHHTPGDQVPNAIAVLDPKQTNCKYPYKELSGCGIGFKLCQAIQHQLQSNFNLPSLLDLVAVSIACDIVPLTGENRVLAAIGLERVNLKPRPSISSLLGEPVPNKKVRISDLVFQLGPKINAAGRISQGKTSVDLLLSEAPIEVANFTEQINNYNNERKDQDKRITDEALAIVNSNLELQSKNSTVLYDKSWHKGVVGIVASRVIEKYYKPTIILTHSKDDIIGGSVRSVKDFDVYQALEKCTANMVQFGGHKYAAGLTLRKEQLPQFIDQFEQVVTSQMEPDKFIPNISYDAEITVEDITFKLKQLIDKLEPFGPQNNTPTFVIRNLIDTGNSRAVGSDKSHLKLELASIQTKKIIPAIAFSFGHLEAAIQSGNPIDIIFTIDVNYWRNNSTLQLMVKDIKFANRK